MTSRAICVFILAVLFGTSLAHAAILTSTGAVEVIAAPADLREGALLSDTRIAAIAERQQVLLPQDLTFNISVPGTSPSATDSNTSPVTLPAGTLVNSYLLHLQSVTGTDASPLLVSGSITFDHDILGIAVFDLRLDQSDPFLGLGTTVYPTGENRQLDIAAGGTVGILGNDSITLSTDRRTVFLNIGNTGGIDQIRIVTASVPEPSSIALVTLAALGLLLGRCRRLVR